LAAHEGAAVVPQAERESAAVSQVSGPTENRGVRSVRSLGDTALAGEFESPDGRILRVREIVVEPGGVVAVHRHQGRPGLAYILAGEIVEHRNDASQPIVRSAGAVSFEKTGVIHWWENRSADAVKALVVDIVPAE
jgi:quercetin dioxygenase-like cupin family protein